MSNPENQTPVVDPVALAGATAQTGGFAQAGSSSSPANPTQSSSTSAPVESSSAAALAPTAQSKPASRSSFAAPTFSSSASTGIFPTTAAIPAQYGYLGGPFGGGLVTPATTGGMQSSPNVPAPGTSIDPKTGKPFSAGMTRAELEAKKAAELSGREQAARQLAGPGLATGASGEITPGKELPGGWGPVQPVPPPGTSPEAPASIYEDVNTVLHKVGATAYAALPASLKEAISNSPPDPKGKGKEGAPSPTARRSSVAVMFDNVKKQTAEVVKTVRDELNDPGPGPVEKDDSLKGPGGRRTSLNQPGLFTQVKGLFSDGPVQVPAGVAGAATFKTSLPSDEPLGAKSGEHVSGVGALPGKATETGVAVLPDEKASGSALPNQSLLPGEISAGVGDLPGPPGEAAAAVPPDVKATEGSAGGFIAVPSGSDAQGPAGADTTATNSGLAAPLPHTTLGSGISEGATDPKIVDGTSTTTSADSSVARTAPPANDRTDSLASVTAIRHGHAGARDAPGSSPLAAEALGTSETSDAGASEPASSTAVGSPATNNNEPIAPSTKPSESAVADSPTTKSKDLPASNGTPASPVSKSAASTNDKGHRRASSTSSSGKKKAGFMNKLKGEMKVISGKIGGDEAKVQAGEKLKHGE